MAKEGPECFGYRENELPMRQLEKDLVGEMLSKEDGPFATAGRTKIKPLAGERPEVVVTAFGIGAAYPRDALEIVAARRKPFPDLLNSLKAIPAVGGGVLLLVVLAEVCEVPLEYGMEFVTATGNIMVPRRGRE